MSTLSPLRQMRELAAQAMIGTDRSAGAGGPDKLLIAAAVVGAKSRAGLKPRRVAGKFAPCPSDDRPAAGAAATATLMRLLAEHDAELIDEWADLAHGRGVRVADASVAAVLDWWSRQPRRSERVFTALGKRGAWLTSLNADWRKPASSAEIPSDTNDVWQAGTAAERAALLLIVRRNDPARGLGLVQSTWRTDGADERRRFIEVLRVGCSMADEPFLESALDDKSIAVRRQAAMLLRYIPGSRLQSRMNDRARDCVVVEGKRGVMKRGVKVSLNPPAKFQEEWIRDGIEEQAGSGAGKRAWWLRQILGAARLSVWEAITGLEPDVLIDAIGKDDYFADALQAMVQAAATSADEVWRQALLKCLLEQKDSELQALEDLLAELPQAQREPLLLQAAQHKRFDAAGCWSILAIADDRWSRGFSLHAMRLLIKHKPCDDAWRLRESVARVSRRISPDAAEAFEKAVSAAAPDPAQESFRQSIDRVRLRADMHKEFAT